MRIMSFGATRLKQTHDTRRFNKKCSPRAIFSDRTRSRNRFPNVNIEYRLSRTHVHGQIHLDARLENRNHLCLHRPNTQSKQFLGAQPCGIRVRMHTYIYIYMYTHVLPERSIECFSVQPARVRDKMVANLKLLSLLIIWNTLPPHSVPPSAPTPPSSNPPPPHPSHPSPPTPHPSPPTH